MYHCGPTVYDHAHIGNLRSYVFADILRRTFEYNGYKVDQVINITDVGHLVGDGDEGEDKMTRALKREGKPLTVEAMLEVATIYYRAFVEDLEALNVELPHHFPRASEHIRQDLDIITRLQDRGFVYTTSDGVYFDTTKLSTYGRLGQVVTDPSLAEARVSANHEKRRQADFAVWKFDQKLGWDSPWGKGFPGWHIECSAMSREYLGQPFDIHTGGIDHIPVHHNNEIAQSEAAFGVPLAHYWLHNAFVTMGKGKMAKSAGGFVTLKSLLEQHLSPLAYRYWLLTAHYRSPIDYTPEAVGAAQNALMRLMGAVSSLPDGGTISTPHQERFSSYINTDLDTPKAIALLWDTLKDPGLAEADKKATVRDMDRVLGLRLDTVEVVPEEEIPTEITALAEAREEAREAQDWAKADALRQEIEDRGYTVSDTKSGIKIQAK